MKSEEQQAYHKHITDTYDARCGNHDNSEWHKKTAWIEKDDFAPGQYPHPVNNVPPEILTRCQRDYKARIKALETNEGVWNDTSMYYVYANK